MSKKIKVTVMVPVSYANMELECEIDKDKWEAMSFEGKCTYMDMEGCPTGYRDVVSTPDPDWYDGVDEEDFEVVEGEIK